MLKIGKLKIDSRLVLAPMAGISDLPFRLLNRKFGCEMTFIEMINCRSISYKSRRTKEMLSSLPQDRPLGIQLLGCEIGFIEKAMDVLENYQFDILDFNAACPAKKVVRRGEGASLLKDPLKLSKILKTVVKKSSVPVTVKIRTGWDKDTVNAVDIASIIQDAGVNGLFIHGRTKAQAYSGKVDYSTIAKVKKALDIPVIASGDVFSAQLVKKMFDETGCDGVAVARGALGNPWIFRESLAYLKNGKSMPLPTKEEIIQIMLEHLDSSVNFYGEKGGVVRFRKFFIWYTKGMRRVRALREVSSRARTAAQLKDIISKI
ncbi:tRNA dihydrouridine synthase DusB [bacterium]|nr:MAG: tRNA dihydrouridine synthase DusB [bacterium]